MSIAQQIASVSSRRTVVSAIARDLAVANEQAKEAYEFAPSSYTATALSSIIAARLAFDALRSVLKDETDR
jgi:hypothetical protein